ncbi:MAG: hypothetical protein K2X38_09740 [Gemmataceae bacterium]|nr:hypothetical protein [Gemmataceae bacterium]
MRHYRKDELAEDDRGFFRYLGGKRFRLGNDRSRAKIAVLRLESMLSRCESWADPVVLRLAQAIARGEQQASLEPNPEMSGSESYVHWVDRYAELLGDIIRILPANPSVYEHGQQAILNERDDQLRQVENAYPATRPVSRDLPHERLHSAIDAYCERLSERTDGSGWIKVKTARARRLKAFPDLPLSQLTLDVMEKMLAYWANRPKVKGGLKTISATTASSQMKEVRDFWKWLHRSDQFGWKRPDGWDELKPRVAQLQLDRQKLIQSAHVPTFTVTELSSLYAHATPLVRCFILLGLNCGFSIAEIASLTTSEVRLSQCHPHGNRLQIASNSTDSWIFRVRHKSRVYGEFKLWPQTAQAVQWALGRASEIAGQNRDLVFVSDRGKPFNAPTRTGNKSSRIPNLWSNLLRTVQKQTGTFRRLPFKYLRKTAGDIIRQVSDGEVVGVFLCHGNPVRTDSLSDVYTNRPFGKVFAAIEKVQDLLSPMFAPFPIRFRDNATGRCGDAEVD